jgi:hypothetical protein
MEVNGRCGVREPSSESDIKRQSFTTSCSWPQFPLRLLKTVTSPTATPPCFAETGACLQPHSRFGLPHASRDQRTKTPVLTEDFKSKQSAR